jgi:heat shock protein HslJ
MVFLCLSLAVVFGGCRLQKASIAFSDLDGEWNVIELNGHELMIGEAKRFLIFDAAGRHLSGNAGCNLISGNIVLGDRQGNNIRFQGIVSTRKACLDMRMEDELLKALDNVTHFGNEEQGKQLKTIAFYGTENQRLFVISQAH